MSDCKWCKYKRNHDEWVEFWKVVGIVVFVAGFMAAAFLMFSDFPMAYPN